MRKIKNITLLSVACALLSCPLSANNDMPEESRGAEATERTATDGTVVHITKADFLTKIFNYEKNPPQWVYEGDKPCIVDFYADWCGPCRAVSPILEELAKQYKGEIIIYKINVDKEKELAGVFGVRSIPTILFVPKEGKPMLAQGALPKEEFVKQIDSFLLKK